MLIKFIVITETISNLTRPETLAVSIAANTIALHRHININK